MSEWSGMLKDFFRQISDRSIAKEQLQLFLEHKNPFIDSKERKEVKKKVAEFKKAYVAGDHTAAEKIAASLGLFRTQTPDKNLTKEELNDLMAIVERHQARPMH